VIAMLVLKLITKLLIDTISLLAKIIFINKVSSSIKTKSLFRWKFNNNNKKFRL